MAQPRVRMSLHMRSQSASACSNSVRCTPWFLFCTCRRTRLWESKWLPHPHISHPGHHHVLPGPLPPCKVVEAAASTRVPVSTYTMSGLWIFLLTFMAPLFAELYAYAYGWSLSKSTPFSKVPHKVDRTKSCLPIWNVIVLTTWWNAYLLMSMSTSFSRTDQFVGTTQCLIHKRNPHTHNWDLYQHYFGPVFG